MKKGQAANGTAAPKKELSNEVQEEIQKQVFAAMKKKGLEIPTPTQS